MESLASLFNADTLQLLDDATESLSFTCNVKEIKDACTGSFQCNGKSCKRISPIQSIMILQEPFRQEAIAEVCKVLSARDAKTFRKFAEFSLQTFTWNSDEERIALHELDGMCNDVWMWTRKAFENSHDFEFSDLQAYSEQEIMDTILEFVLEHFVK